MRLGKTLIVFVLVAIAAMSAGCKATEELLTPEPVIITQEATVAIPAAAVNGEIPGDAPASIPLWPGSKLISARSTGDDTYTMLLSANEDFDDVVSGMSVGFERAGWNVTQESAEDGLSILEVSNGEHEGVVTIASAEGTVTIDFLLTPLAK